MKKLFLLLVLPLFFTSNSKVVAQEEFRYPSTEPTTLSQKPIVLDNVKTPESGIIGDKIPVMKLPILSQIKASDPSTSDADTSRDVFTLPFKDNFTGYPLKWSIIDENEDGQTWFRYGGGRNGGNLMYYVQEGTYTNGNDYLITVDPVEMPAGKSFFKVWYRTDQYSGFQTYESFELLYGKTNKINSLTTIGGVILVNNTGWLPLAVPFQLEEAGDYYFAIKATSPGNLNYGLAISDVTIDTGELKPDLLIQYVLASAGGCGCSATEKIGFNVLNEGDVPVTSFTINYSIDGQQSSQIFNTGLASMESEIVYLDPAFDFSQINKTYEIRASVATPNDNNSSNDSISHSVVTSTPLELPVSNFLLTREDATFYHPGISGAWRYNPNYIGITGIEPTSGAMVADMQDVPMYTSCFNLDRGTYILNFSYFAGWRPGTDDFEVRVGKSGTDISTWSTIASFFDIEEMPIFEAHKTVFFVPEAGDYRIAFISTHRTFLAIGYLTLSKGHEHDITIDKISNGFNLPAIPYKQLGENSAIEHTVTVTNTGNSRETFDLELLLDGTVVDSKNVTLSSSETDDVIFSTVLAPVAKTLTFTARANVPNDGYNEDNSKSLVLNVGNTFATESLTENDNDKFTGIALAYNGHQLANVYTLREPDELESMTILFHEGATRSVYLRINVYALDYEILEDFVDNSRGQYYALDIEPLYSAYVTRPAGGGFKTYELPEPLALDAEKYCFSVTQLDDEILTAYLPERGGEYYVSGEMSLDGVTTRIYLQRMDDYPGYVTIRANFVPSVTGVEAVQNNIDLNVYASRNLFSVNASERIDNVTIFDVTGNSVHRSARGLNSYDYTTNISRLASGMYLAHIQTTNGTKTAKFIVK
ncbi:MAG: choice-of-anchor J domain-containing protein [Bacteroidales bacterium]|jgi:hypothetical protein|nr:choice-of-anchor J domain-containing protein [Bacteroidales bacterium]